MESAELHETIESLAPKPIPVSIEVAQKCSKSAEEFLEVARQRVKANPLATIVGVAVAGVILGMGAGWIMGKRQ